MKKKIVIIAILCILISIVFIIKICNKPNYKSDTIINKNETKIETELENEKLIEEKNDVKIEIKQDEVVTDSVNTNSNESPKEEKKEQPIEKEKTPKVEKPIIPQEVPKNSIPSNNTEKPTTDNSGTISQPDSSNIKETNPWDSLGITEDDYYNKPAHNWAEIDFSVKTYGDRSATLKACQDYGNNYIAEHGGGYFCDSVNSYSGNYLGEDIDFY